MSRDSNYRRVFNGKLAIYPASHKPGMRVPEGGSMCANCEYLKDADKRICGNPDFVRWNGSEIIPAPVDQYCSDWWTGKVESH